MIKKRFRQSTLLLLAVCVAFMLGGCNGVKTIGFVTGSWSAENLQVGEIEIDQITLTITEDYNEGEEYIFSNGNRYGCYVNVSGGNVVVKSVTYVERHKRYVNFEWENNDFNLSIETKQDSQYVFIEAGITVENDSVTFTMN